MYKNSSDEVGSMERLSRKQCAASCCSTAGCTHYQEAPDKGCFHNDNKSNPQNIKCDEYLSQYTGGFKVNKRDYELFKTEPSKNTSVIIIDKSKVRTQKSLRSMSRQKK